MPVVPAALGLQRRSPGPLPPVSPCSPGPPFSRVPVQFRAPYLPCPQGGVGPPSRALTAQFLPRPPPRGLGAVVPRGGHLRSGGARAPCSPAPLSHPVGREDPKAGREAHCGRPLRSRLQQAGQQGGAAGLGGQCHRDGGADRALRRARRRGLDSEVRFLCCAHYVFRVLLWDAHGCK